MDKGGVVRRLSTKCGSLTVFFWNPSLTVNKILPSVERKCICVWYISHHTTCLAIILSKPQYFSFPVIWAIFLSTSLKIIEPETITESSN